MGLIANLRAAWSESGQPDDGAWGDELLAAINDRERDLLTRADEPATYFAGPRREGGLVDGGTTSTRQLIENTTGWPVIAQAAIAERISALDLQVGVLNPDGDFEAIEHPLDAAFDANDSFGLDDLLWIAASHMLSAGEAYWLVVENGLRVPSEFWPLMPQNVTTIYEPTGQVSEYRFQSEGGEQLFGPEEIIAFRRPDPRNFFRGGSPLQGQAIVHDAHRFLDETVANHYAHDATPRILFEAHQVAGQGMPSLPQGKGWRRLMRTWRLFYRRRGGRYSGLPGFAPPGWKSTILPALGGFTGSEQFAEHYRDRLLMAYGVPRSVLGDVVDANRAAAETNRYVFDLHAVTPWSQRIARTLTRFARRAFAREDLVVRFEPFLIPDAELELRREDQDLRTMVRTINEVRATRDLDPAAHGEEPVATLAQVPYRPDEPLDFQTPAEDEGDEEDERADDPVAAYIARVRRRFDPDAVWARQVRLERQYIGEMSQAVRKGFAKQRNRAIDALRAEPERARALYHDRGIDELIELLTGKAWRNVFTVEAFPILRRAFRQVLAQVLRDLEADVPQATFDAEVLSILERQGAEMVTNVNETTRRRLVRALQAGVAAGEGIDDLERRVNRVFRGRRGNARTIAQTEIVTAVQGAQLDGFELAEVPRKRWNTSRDEAVRDSHEIDGQEAGRSEPFTLGDGEPAMAPGVGVGGSSLSAGNRINCRCFVTPVF